MPRGSTRAAGWLSWPGLVAGAALVLATMVTLATAGPPAGAATAKARASMSCGKDAGPFSIRGIKVLGRGGRVFIPYGMTVPDLVSPNWLFYLNLDRAKIAATADDWCANTVRLQLSQDNLVGPNGTRFTANTWRR